MCEDGEQTGVEGGRRDGEEVPVGSVTEEDCYTLERKKGEIHGSTTCRGGSVWTLRA